MSRKTFLLVLLVAGSALAARPWSASEFDEFNRTFQPSVLPRPESLIHGPRRFNYLERIHRLCEFIRQYQVSDSLSADFGGIIEAEHMPTTIETDNTQEAIWVWSRWYELTGLDDYRESIRRAWVYVRHHPAFREHNGDPQYFWYSVWNCGLGFMAESRYRAAYGDSAFRAYADTCRSFYLANPLTTAVLDRFVTSQSSGMAYDYALEFSDAVLRDTALARTNRVRLWIEQSPSTNLAAQNWAMSGGTAFWGVAHAWCRADAALGNAWLNNYTQYLPGFYPGGNWNCSHNIWLANAYRAAAEPLGIEDWWQMHQYLTDTLLFKDTDNDGGIPATWTDPNTMDQTWVSTYLDFMAMDVFVTPVYDHDLSVLDFTAPDPRGIYIAPCTLAISVPVANVGRAPTGASLSVTAPGYLQSVSLPTMPMLETDTITMPVMIAATPGSVTLTASLSGDDNLRNDTSRLDLRVYGVRTVDGCLTDSATGDPVHAWLRCRITGDAAVWDSCETDRSGCFSLRIIDTLVSIDLRTWAPYFDRTWNVALAGDTTIDLVTQPAHVLVLNNDSAGRYAEYYTSTLDTLDINWCLWNYRAQGAPPYVSLDRLRAHTVIWYSGDAVTGTVPPADQESLTAALGRGTNLLVTGQNVAEELAGTPFLETTLGTHFDSSGYTGLFVFGNRADSVGTRLKGTSTAGGNGANNQSSRDVVSPLGSSAGLFVYDSVTPRFAATRRDAGPAKVVFLGFGFEAVNRPAGRPSYWNRVQVLGLVLNWFSPGIGVEEGEAPGSSRTGPRPLASTIVRNTITLTASPGTGARVHDPSGRIVLSFTEPLDPLNPRTLDISVLSPGVYFLESDAAVTRFIKVR
jgi:hypothetical protein